MWIFESLEWFWWLFYHLRWVLDFSPTLVDKLSCIWMFQESGFQNSKIKSIEVKNDICTWFRPWQVTFILRTTTIFLDVTSVVNVRHVLRQHDIRVRWASKIILRLGLWHEPLFGPWNRNDLSSHAAKLH